MRKFASWLSPVLLWAFLMLPVSAEELWVRNRPFQGQVQGSGPAMMVELQPLVKALDLELNIQGDSVVFEGFQVPIKRGADGAGMVQLSEFASAAGLKVKRNPELGTIDVHAASVGTGSRGDWSTVGANDESSSSGGSGKKYEGPNYTIRVPGSLEMMNDPATMGFLKSYIAQQEGAGALGGAEFGFVVRSRSGSSEGVMLMMSAPGPTFSPGEAETMEKVFVEGLTKSMTDGGTLIEPPSPQQLGKDRFYKSQHSEQDADGTRMMETWVHINGKYGRVFILMIVDSQKTFSATAAKLRPCLRSFRLK